jgi:hypothetical protein
VSARFDLHVDLTLADDVADDELATVRWLFGLGPQPDTFPASVPDDTTTPLVTPQGDDERPWVPGGAHARLVRWAGTWSLGAHGLIAEGNLYEDGWQSLAWLASVSATRGLYASAREEGDLLPSWLVFSFDRHCYLLHDGRLVPTAEGAPDPPAWAVEQAARGLR